MYTAQFVISQIDSALIASGISKAQLCSDLGINRNTINKMTDKNGISSFTLARIADYLGVSVDYLLGRDTRQSNSITQSNINGNNSAHIDNSSLSEMDKQLLELFDKLPITQKAEIIMKMSEMLFDK